MPHIQTGVGSIRPALNQYHAPSKRSSTPSDAYNDGFDDARRGTAPEKRIAVYQADSEQDTNETRDKLQKGLDTLLFKEKQKSAELAEAERELNMRPPQNRVGLSVIAVLIAGWAGEVVMMYPVAELWTGANPVFLWVAVLGLATLAPLSIKLAIREHPPFGVPPLRWVCGALGLAMVVILSHERARALSLEAQMGDWFVSALVGERMWATFLSLLAVNATLAFLMATLTEMLTRQRHTTKVRRKWTRLKQEHSDLRTRVAHAQKDLATLGQNAAARLRTRVSEYELGYAHGCAGEGEPQEQPGPRGWAMLRRQGTAVLFTALALAAAGCSDSLVDPISKNVTVVILDPFGADPMPKETAFDIAHDVLARTDRCTTLLFATPKGYQRDGQSYRLMLPCSAARQRRDQDLGAVYEKFHEEFPERLDQWFHVTDENRWRTDYSGTLRRAEEELRIVDGNRFLVVLSGLWWPDPEKGPPALAPLPSMDFSGTHVYLGFTHGFASEYDYNTEKRKGSFSAYPQFIENWAQRFREWKVPSDQLTTAAFGPQQAPGWIARNISKNETDAYVKWQQQRAFRERQAPSPQESPRDDELQRKKSLGRRPLLDASYSVGPVGQ